MIKRRKKIRILLPQKRPEKQAIWGEHYFGISLSRAMARAGLGGTLDYFRDTRNGVGSRRWPYSREIDFLIWYGCDRPKKRGRRMVLWVLWGAEQLSDEMLASAEHIFVASRTVMDDLAAKGWPVSFLPQCTDTTLFSSRPRLSVLSSDVLFVGNASECGPPRPSVMEALGAGLNVSVWGAYWENFIPPNHLSGRWIANEDLADHYASAQVVLNDHNPTMTAQGFASNRIFDVLACGVPLVSDRIIPGAGLEPELAGQIQMYDPGGMAEAVEKARAVTAQDRVECAEYVARHHSFDARVAEIASVMGIR